MSIETRGFSSKVVALMSRDPSNMNPYEPMYLSDKSVSPSHFATAAALQHWIRLASTLPSTAPTVDLEAGGQASDAFGAHRQPRKKRHSVLKRPKRAKRDKPSKLSEDGDVVATPSRIPNMSLGEMRKCLNQVRAMSPSQLNPDNVLSNGMTLGDFGVAFVDNSIVSAGGSSHGYHGQAHVETPSRPASTDPSEPAFSVQHPRRLKQTCMTDFVGRVRF